MARTLLQMVNAAEDQAAFRRSTTVGNQMMAIANNVQQEIRDHYPWGKLRKSTTITMATGDLDYALPADFWQFIPESMWEDGGSREVVIPTSDRYWGFLDAGNPGSGITFHAKFIGGELVFDSVVDATVINLDYVSRYALTDTGGTPKEFFTADTDLFLLDEETLILGIKAFWKIEKEIPTAQIDLMRFQKRKNSDITRDQGGKTIRARSGRYYRGASPLSEDYVI